MCATTVLRKRKHIAVDDPLVLHLFSPSPSYDALSDTDCDPPYASTHISEPSKRKVAKAGDNKRNRCSHEGCTKTYSKPSRLAEHERTHTGHRPFQCPICNKSYLRESHLQAHARSHLPSSSRPFMCDESGCEKRFWTAQHLRVHVEWHKGEKPLKCSETDCEAAFAKHHQLREHNCLVHSPPGTKPYRCEHEGCAKSFFTAQKLRTHLKTHDDKRYTCVHPVCAVSGQTTPTYYATWTALQKHMRDTHPPTCPHESCKGKTFTAQKGLRAHMKIHEQRDLEVDLRGDTYESGDEGAQPPQKKRRGGEVGRDFVCDFEGCDKDFKSKKALTDHRNVNHLGRRDFVCTHAECKRAFGYKHLLQRHLAKVHIPEDMDEYYSSTSSSSEDDLQPPQQQSASLNIDDITGVSYSTRAKTQTDKLRCPYPDVTHLVDDGFLADSRANCVYVFTRAYDLRRHLKSNHGLSVTKDRADKWVQRAKKARVSEA